MNTKEFIEKVSLEEVERVANDAGTKMAYLNHIAFGRKNASVPLADRLVKASGGRLEFDLLVRATPDRQDAAVGK